MLVPLLSFIVPSMAWQSGPPLSLTVVADPPVAMSEEMLLLTFTVSNTSNKALAQVQVKVEVPEHTALESANVSSAKWAVSTPGRGERGTVTYLGMSEMAPGESGQLGLWVIVHQQTGKAIVLDTYTAMAKGLKEPVIGSPLTIWVGSLPTPEPTSTTFLPTATATPLPTVTATPTAIPATPTATPLPTPSPTITVAVAEIPPTPTPNLSSEREQLGTLSVSIFVVVTISIVVLSVVWIVRRKNKRE